MAVPEVIDLIDDIQEEKEEEEEEKQQLQMSSMTSEQNKVINKNHIKMSNTNNNHHLVQKTMQIFTRQSDEIVLGDIIQVIKSWTKLRVKISRKPTNGSDNNNETTVDSSYQYLYNSFITKDRIPCYVKIMPNNPSNQKESLPQHPAVRGVELLVEAFSLIDAFGPVLDEVDTIPQWKRILKQIPSSDDEQDDATTTEENMDFVIDEVLVGLTKRHVMIREFLASLEGEICQFWPAQDRTNRITSPSLHFSYLNNSIQEEEKDDNETTIEDNHVNFESTRSAGRLASLAERCILARLVTSIHLYRGKINLAVDFMFRYLLSTAPSLDLEEYPKYPPVQSMCVLEAILTTQYNPFGRTLLDYIQKNIFVETMFYSSDIVTWLSKTFYFSLSACAGIYRIRSSHADSRIAEMALVEVAAYQRVVQKLNFGVDIRNSHTRASDLVSNFR